MSGLTSVVLVGGMGTRLRPLTYTVPKQLIPIAGQCVLYHVFDLLPPEVDRIVLACGYKADEIEKHLKEHPYRLPVKLVRENTPLGTGGGMKNVSSLATDPFVLLNGDVVSGLDVGEMLRDHARHGGFGTMSLFEVEDTKPYGVAQLDKDKRIVRFVEKPEPEVAPSHWINAGASVWKREVMDHIPAGRPVSFETEVVPGLLDKGVFGYTFRSWWEDAGAPDRVLNAQRLLFDNPDRRRHTWRKPAGKNVAHPVAVGENARLDGKRIGKYVTLGDNVSVEDGAVVEDSIIMDGAVVGKGATVTHSIVGPGYVVPPGTLVKGSCLALSP
jgi:mannose-1-phosphate guanylyltransferase